MKLFVLRHGNAELYAASDAQRNLTARGVAETQAVLQADSSLSTVTRILASPYARAQQTALLASQALGLPVETSPLLVPEAQLNAVVELLEGFGDESLLLVSHQPFVGGFVDWLADLNPGRHIMGTSALAHLDVSVFARGCADLISIKQP